MLRDVYWRQYPIDLLNDEKMGYIESKMPAGYEYAPYMFYITALKLADDDGIFDLEDGIIFARLMRVKDVQIVFDIANLMRKYKIMYRLSDDENIQLCGIVDWSYSDKKKRTLAERKQVVMAAIERERAKSMSTKDFGPVGCAGKCNDIPQSKTCVGKCNDIPQGPGNIAPVPAQDAPEPAQSAVFFMPEDDKNRKNVVINADDDKSGENVTDIQTDSTNNTVQEVHTNTHTQTPAYGPMEGPPADVCQNSIPAVADTQNSETKNQTDSEQAASSGDIAMLAEQALSQGETSSEKKDTALFDYLNDFFVKNCYGYKPKQSAKAIEQLADKISEISDEMNPPVDVAAVLCTEYKKMTEGGRSEYWKGQPLLPAYMIKPRCWMELMQYAGKILATKSSKNSFYEAMEKARIQADAERKEIVERIDAEYEKYGINQNSPSAVMELLRAKNLEKNAQEPEEQAAETEMPEDIF